MASAQNDFQYKGQGWRGHFKQQLAKLTKLPDDNGNWGPNRPDSSLIDEASQIPIAIKNDTLPWPNVTATSDGAIQVSWFRSGQELSIFLYPDAKEWVFRSLTGGTEIGTVLEIDQINALFERFV